MIIETSRSLAVIPWHFCLDYEDADSRKVRKELRTQKMQPAIITHKGK